MAGEELLRSGDAGEEERDICEVAEHDDREQRCTSAIDPPAQHAVQQFDGERGRRCATVKTEAELAVRRSRPQRNVGSVRCDIENQVRNDSNGDGPTESASSETAFEDPLARLERAFIDEFLAARGTTLSTVGERPPAERQDLLTQAARYAAGRLAEIDARAAYLHEIHGGSEKG